MQRVTISLDDALAEQFDDLVNARAYSSRSEAIRDVMRDALAVHMTEEGETGHCVANLSYVYNHHERGMAARLMDIHHAHHHSVMATSHVHLDHDNCLETVMLKGPVKVVRELADAIRSERGVRHGVLNLIAVHTHEAHTHEHD